MSDWNTIATWSIDNDVSNWDDAKGADKILCQLPHLYYYVSQN